MSNSDYGFCSQVPTSSIMVQTRPHENVKSDQSLDCFSLSQQRFSFFFFFISMNQQAESEQTWNKME